jgi:hypothetical protein
MAFASFFGEKSGLGLPYEDQVVVGCTTIDFPGATATQLRGINPQGDLVGFYSDAGGLHGFVATKGQKNSIIIP